jgi:predicted permease
METLIQDIRYAIRQLRNGPTFALVAVVTLALGIGANTVIFSVVNGVMLSPLPFPQPDQLVTLHENKPNFMGGSLSYPNFRDWQKDNHTFSSMAVGRRYAFSLTGLGDPEQANGEFISSDYFSILGVNPVLGRTFAPGEDQVGAGPVALISAGLWQRKFSSATDVLGKSMTLDARDYTIVGVIPANFHLAIPGFTDSDVYVPIGQWGNPLLLKRGAGLGIHGLGRLKPGVSIEQARADMETVTRNLTAAYPDADKEITAQLVPLKRQMIGGVRAFLTVLLAAVGFVLLIACANVANLLLARSTKRTREFAVRVALGASRIRVIRQLLTESVLLALAGGVLGLLLAAWGTHSALQILPAALPRAEQIGLDWHVLLFTFAITMLAGVVFGLAPALKAAQRDLQDQLKQGGRGMSGGHHRTQGAFVVVEMALAVVLLIGAGLTIRSLMRLWSVDPGFNPHNVFTFGLSLPPTMMNANPEAIRNAFRDFDARLASMPGVHGVSQAWGAIPFYGDDEQLFWREGEARPQSDNAMSWAIDYIVEPDYLRAMEIPLQHGRFFTAHDDEHSPLVVVVDEVFEQKYFPHEDPIGKRINLNRGSSGQLAEIVGVVQHANQWGLDRDDQQPLRAELYLPCMQMPDDFIGMAPSGSAVIVRSSQPAGLADQVKKLSAAMSSQQVIFGVQTMDSLISQSLASRQFSMILLMIFASLALLLASVGIYGVVSYVVAQRVHEIGLRMALGARPLDILGLILGGAGKLALAGVVAGLAAALGVTRMMASLLYGISAADPITFVTVAVLLTAIALLACLIPARRAAKVDPAVALRCE